MLFLSRTIFITAEETRIIANPKDVVVERGYTAQFTVKAGGYGNFTYQWYHNSTILPSKTESDLYIYNSMEQNSGLYYCRICNQDNNCASSTRAELTLSCMLLYACGITTKPCMYACK